MKGSRVVAVLPLIVVVGCGSTMAGSAMPESAALASATVNQPFTLTGTLELGHSCSTAGSGYGDIERGAQVVVRVDGKTAAVGSVGASTPMGHSSCSFIFTVTDVPGGEKFYEVEVTHRGGINFTEEEMRHGVSLSLGG